MNAPTQQADDLHLVALPTAINCADLFVQFSLTEWSLAALWDSATRAVRLLVTAAVDCANPDAPGILTVRLRLCGNELVIEVEGTQVDQLPDYGDGRTGILTLSRGRQLIWCALPLPAGMSASSVPLPRRERRRSPAAAAMADEPTGVDPQMMERILFGLNRTNRRQAD